MLVLNTLVEGRHPFFKAPKVIEEQKIKKVQENPILAQQDPNQESEIPELK